MNFIEAMKTGRPFKRANWHGYVKGLTKGLDDGRYPNIIYWIDPLAPSGTRHGCSVEELLAEDWEVQPDERLISRTKLQQVLTCRTDKSDVDINKILRELGF